MWYEIFYVTDVKYFMKCGMRYFMYNNKSFFDCKIECFTEGITEWMWNKMFNKADRKCLNVLEQVRLCYIHSKLIYLT